MALRALMMAKKLNEKRNALETATAKLEELAKREKELEKAIEEAQTEEEEEAVKEAVEEFETEKREAEETKANLEKEVEELEANLKEEEEAQDLPEETGEKRGVITKMETRKFFNLTNQERDAFFADDRTKNYLNEVRSAIREKRAISGVGLTIPENWLGLLRQNIQNYSKLYKHVDVRQIAGDGRGAVMGNIPEAVWTDCCANLNELDLYFYSVEVGCWKLGGFYAVCNANLEDSDIALATELLTVLSQAMGYALDKAIDYGTGNRMPLGIVSRLAQTSQPEGYPATARPWVNLSETNIITIPAGTTGAALISAIAEAVGNAKGAYSRGEKVWQMNEKTYNSLVASSISVDASGAIVAGVKGSMPALGGVIEVLDFIPNNVIIAGYLDLYLLAERAGAKFATSEHVRFLQDQTIFKATSRYDGTPEIAEAFVAIGLNGTTPSAEMTFAQDTANDEEGA